MTIAVGDRLPEAKFIIPAGDELAEKTTSDVFAGKKIALFAVPGAFTGTCTNTHLPGFLSSFDTFKAKGVDEIVCVAVNDPFVLKAWALATGADGAITFLSDGNAEFTKALGLDFDGSAKNFGTRSKRYSMLVEDGIVKSLNVEEVNSNAVASSAENLLKQL
ncbi:MAG TPA: peroxiredoxin [Hyphomicrobiales bacterium]|nr:peroxiredoxin [Hyphomicrobiales bacterium]